MTLEEIGDIVNEIRADIKVMQHDLSADYKAIHGNGKPGLIEDVHQLQVKVEKLETRHSLTREIIGHLITLLAALLAIWFKQ